jgi:hydroxymethylpyrimidine/phosphomethylpyrimidine kinase
MQSKPVVLTIAGSDSGAGAGIQSDLKTFHNLGVYGVTTITAITSQNTKGVQRSFEVPVNVIKSQLKSLFNDFNIRVVKTGMLSSSKVIDSIYSILKNIKNLKLIIDPVLFSKNGFVMLDVKGTKLLKNKLLPHCFLVTPNFREGEILSGVKFRTFEDMELACKILHEYGAKNVLIKGGHLTNNIGLPFASDLLYSHNKFFIFPAPHIDTKHTHGLGCTFSSAIAAKIAQGKKLDEAIIEAKVYIENKLRQAQRIGKGISPVEL